MITIPQQTVNATLAYGLDKVRKVSFPAAPTTLCIGGNRSPK
jgi:hypothetical protein